MPTAPSSLEPPPAELSHAGAVVDKAIEYMMGQNISSLAIASSLLGGAMALLARRVADEAIVQILNNAIVSVRAGAAAAGANASGGATEAFGASNWRASVEPRALSTPAK